MTTLPTTALATVTTPGRIPLRERLGREASLKYLLVLPAVLVVAATAIWPLLYSLILAFRDWHLARSPRPGPVVGIQNFTRALTDSDVLASILHTVVFVALTVTFTTLLALGIALLLARGGLLRRIVQAILILPFAMSPALVGVSWRFLFNPEFGLFSALARTLIPALQGVDWLASPTLAFATLVLADVWSWTPFMTLILIGGLASIPQDTVEAARVDGAPAWRVVRDIIVPQLGPVLAVVVILKTIFALKAFDVIFMLTQGGPGQSTQTLVYQAYLNGFKYFNMGYAAAISWLMVIPMVGLLMLYTRFVFRRA